MLDLPSVTSGQALEALGTITGSSPATTTVLLATGAVVLARLVGFIMVAPFFGSMNIPMTARVAFSVVMTAVITPYVVGSATAGIAETNGGLGFLLLLVNQLLIGIMLGFVGAFIFYAIESAGRIIDTQRGTNITDLIAPGTGERTSPSGSWLMMLALMIMLTSGQHMLLLDAMLDSFKAFPPSMSLDWIGDPLTHDTGLITRFADLSGESLKITVQIAAPAMISLMLADVLLGIINRGAPQVNVFALSQVIKGPIGIAALLIGMVPIIMLIEHDLLPGVFHGRFSIREFAELMNIGGRGAS